LSVSKSARSTFSSDTRTSDSVQNPWSTRGEVKRGHRGGITGQRAHIATWDVRKQLCSCWSAVCVSSSVYDWWPGANCKTCAQQSSRAERLGLSGKRG
jgi:hypothetical protein